MIRIFWLPLALALTGCATYQAPTSERLTFSLLHPGDDPALRLGPQAVFALVERDTANAWRLLDLRRYLDRPAITDSHQELLLVSGEDLTNIAPAWELPGWGVHFREWPNTSARIDWAPQVRARHRPHRGPAGRLLPRRRPPGRCFHCG